MMNNIKNIDYILKYTRGKRMIWFFRGLSVFSLMNTVAMSIYGGAGGMIPVWVLVTIIAFILSFKKSYEAIFKKLWIKIPFFIGLMCFVVVEGWIVWNGFRAVPQISSDFIIILGAQVRGTKPSATLKYRLDKGYEYLMANPETKAILSGGQGPDEIITEAEGMYHYLVEKGISESRLILEDESHSTRENLINSFALIDAETKNATVSVVSNRFHILRAQMQAKKLGRIVGGIGAKSYPYLIPNYYFREFFAVLKELVI